MVVTAGSSGEKSHSVPAGDVNRKATGPDHVRPAEEKA
jgi:hypothetical protein